MRIVLQVANYFLLVFMDKKILDLIETLITRTPLNFIFFWLNVLAYYVVLQQIFKEI